MDVGHIDDLVYLEAFELELIPDSFEHALIREEVNADEDYMALHLEPLKGLAKFGNVLLRGLVRPILKYEISTSLAHLINFFLHYLETYLTNPWVQKIQPRSRKH